MTRKMFLIALTVLISIPFAIFPSSTNADRKDKVILWTRYLGGAMFDYGPCITDGQYVWISSKKTVRCFDAFSGNNLWNRDFEASGNVSPLFKISLTQFKKCIIAGAQKKLTSLDKATGKILWESNLDTTSNIEIVRNSIFVAAGEVILKADAKSGKILTKKAIPDKEGYSFINVVDGNRIVVSNYKGLCKMVNLAKGTVVWENSKGRTELWERPLICRNYLAVPGMMLRSEKLHFVDLATGLTTKEDFIYGSQIDISDGRLVSSNFCYNMETLEPLWETRGQTSFYDCFDAVCLSNFDQLSIINWSGKLDYSKSSNNSNISWSPYFEDGIGKTPASFDGRYYFSTIQGYLVAYGNKPDLVSFTSGDGFLIADGKKIELENKPVKNSDGQLIVDPKGFLEPLGWVSSHYDSFKSDFVVFHNYQKLLAIASSTDNLYKPVMDKIIPATTTDDGTLMIPIETMVTEFGLTMTKDGDKYKFSYPSK